MAHVVPCSPARLTLLLPANKMMTEAGSLLFANFANKFANMCFNLQTINIFYKYKVVFCLFRKIILYTVTLRTFGTICRRQKTAGQRTEDREVFVRR
jgi:hypothetical protein